MFTINITRGFHLAVTVRAGHSKWANIKHIKALKDGQRSLAFVKLSRQIRLAIQDGGSPNPEINSPLRSAIEEALKKNMPNSTIKNILKKYTGRTAADAQLKKHILEMKLLNKIFAVAVLYTDNLNAVKITIATLIRKAGGNFTDSKHMFTDKGIILGSLSKEIVASNDFEELCMEHAIESGAEECEVTDGSSYKSIVCDCNFVCSTNELDKVRQNLLQKGWLIESFEHAFIPNMPITISEVEMNAYTKFKEKLRNVDGIEDIYDNLEEKN